MWLFIGLAAVEAEFKVEINLAVDPVSCFHDRIIESFKWERYLNWSIFYKTLLQ